MAHIVLGVGGGIAAYKACELARLFTEAGHDLRVVPTAAALRFVGAPTWEALSGQPVTADVFVDVPEVPHVRLGQRADLVVVAPATADLLAKAAAGMADDLLTNTLLTARAPVVFAPAMHTEMWEHPATVANVRTLRERGALVLDPATGRLTGADTGKGRLPDPPEIFEVAIRALSRGSAAPDLSGVTVVVSAGGTREPLDPVRFLGNRSSGRQGYAFARAALARGAAVTIVAANVSLPAPAGAHVVPVETTEQLRQAMLSAAPGADVVVMAAAPSDFRPADYTTEKIKKEGSAATLTLPLVATPDIAAELGAGKPEAQVLVAFAAETVAGEAAVANAHAKLTRKGADMIVLNEVGPDESGQQRAFGTEDNTVTVLDRDGTRTALSGSKGNVADAVLDLVKTRLTRA